MVRTGRDLLLSSAVIDAQDIGRLAARNVLMTLRQLNDKLATEFKQSLVTSITM